MAYQQMNTYIFGERVISIPHMHTLIVGEEILFVILILFIIICSIVRIFEHKRRIEDANILLGLAKISSNRQQIRLTDDELLKVYRGE